MRLTTDQIRNWRSTLAFVYGPFAQFSDEQIETMAQQLQDQLNTVSKMRRIENEYSQSQAAKAENTNKRLEALADCVMEAIE
jgi:hypothetical protein